MCWKSVVEAPTLIPLRICGMTLKKHNISKLMELELEFPGRMSKKSHLLDMLKLLETDSRRLGAVITDHCKQT